ncbi:MAG: CopD family protein [Pseudomonadota bacterium]
MLYLLFKSLHIVFMVTWFAGLFYLPRLFIYHRAASDQISLERFVIMEKRLFGIMTIGAALTLVFGVSLLLKNPALLKVGWFHAKLLLLLALAHYHMFCRKIMRELAAGECQRSDKWLRFYNEVPAILVLLIVPLAVLKPF